jgi:hypothetical protein
MGLNTLLLCTDHKGCYTNVPDSHPGRDECFVQGPNVEDGMMYSRSTMSQCWPLHFDAASLQNLFRNTIRCLYNMCVRAFRTWYVRFGTASTTETRTQGNGAGPRPCRGTEKSTARSHEMKEITCRSGIRWASRRQEYYVGRQGLPMISDRCCFRQGTEGCIPPE